MDAGAKSNQVHIPVIDISSANPKAAEELLAAARQFGFIFVANDKNTGVPPDLIHEVFDLAQQFFALPVETKAECSINSNTAGKNHGWLSQGVEKLDPANQKRPDVKEAFNMGEPLSGLYEQPLPDLFQQHFATLLAFQHACHGLCQRLLVHLATALEMPSDWFTSRHDRNRGPSGTVFRMLYYPRPEATDRDGEGAEQDVDIRAGAHSDYGSLTCLFQLPGQPGLEIRTPSGKWAAVPVDPNGPTGVAGSSSDESKPLPILVNIGDLLEDWTGGLLKSTVHRVVFPAEEAGDRYSMAYFCHPLDEALLEPVPSRVVEEHIAAQQKDRGEVEKEQAGEKKVITARDHLMARLAETYSIK